MKEKDKREFRNKKKKMQRKTTYQKRKDEWKKVR